MASISSYPKQLRRLWHIHRQFKNTSVPPTVPLRWMNTHRVRSPIQKICRASYPSRNLATIPRGDQKKELMFSSDFKPDIDLDVLAQNAEIIADRISHRKGKIDVHEVVSILSCFGIKFKMYVQLRLLPLG